MNQHNDKKNPAGASGAVKRTGLSDGINPVQSHCNLNGRKSQPAMLVMGWILSPTERPRCVGRPRSKKAGVEVKCPICGEIHIFDLEPGEEAAYRRAHNQRFFVIGIPKNGSGSSQ